MIRNNDCQEVKYMDNERHVCGRQSGHAGTHACFTLDNALEPCGAEWTEVPADGKRRS